MRFILAALRIRYYFRAKTNVCYHLNRFITKEEFLRKSITRHSSTGIVSNDTDSKVNLAFKIFDENHDGYVTEKEMRNHSKITKSQVNVRFIISRFL